MFAPGVVGVQDQLGVSRLGGDRGAGLAEFPAQLALGVDPRVGGDLNMTVGTCGLMVERRVFQHGQQRVTQAGGAVRPGAPAVGTAKGLAGGHAVQQQPVHRPAVEIHQTRDAAHGCPFCQLAGRRRGLSRSSVVIRVRAAVQVTADIHGLGDVLQIAVRHQHRPFVREFVVGRDRFGRRRLFHSRVPLR